MAGDKKVVEGIITEAAGLDAYIERVQIAAAARGFHAYAEVVGRREVRLRLSRAGASPREYRVYLPEGVFYHLPEGVFAAARRRGEW